MTRRFGPFGMELALVAVAAVWGGTFVMVKDAVGRYPLYAFLGWRFAIAVVAFVALFPKTFTRFAPGTVRVGVLAGAFLTAGYVFQTWGLQDPATSASQAAFITGMFVVFTPLLQVIVLRKPPRAAAVGGVVAAVIGLWLLTGASAGGWSVGSTRLLLCALAYSGHMIVLGGPGRAHDARALTLVQLTVTCVACAAVSAVFEHAAVPSDPTVIGALVVTGVFASAVAFAVQTYAQRRLSPTRTALILIMEPVFGGIFGYVFAHDVLGVAGWAGAALIFAGMVSSEVVAALRPGRDTRSVLEPSLEGMPVPMVEPLKDD